MAPQYLDNPIDNCEAVIKESLERFKVDSFDDEFVTVLIPESRQIIIDEKNKQEADKAIEEILETFQNNHIYPNEEDLLWCDICDYIYSEKKVEQYKIIAPATKRQYKRADIIGYRKLEYIGIGTTPPKAKIEVR